MASLFPQPGPLLPGFPTLLITGPYHASAPIHLALTLNAELGPQAHALILAPSRTLFKNAIQRLNDHWLYTNSGTGRNATLATSVTLLYPPTPVHLSLVLSMLYVPGTENQYVGLHPKTTQIVAPSLVVLAEPSWYFLSSVDTPMSSASVTLSSYINLVTRAFALVSNLTRGNAPSKFVLFDSQLDKLKLPLTSQPSKNGGGHQPHKIPALPLVEKLFRWVGIFEDDESYVPSSQGDEVNPEEGVRMQLRLYQADQDGEGDGEIYHWTETRHHGNGEVEEVHFRWPVCTQSRF